MEQHRLPAPGLRAHVADKVKELGGRPFITDTCTLTYSPYPGRSMGLDLIAIAERNGFSSAILGVPFIPGDGFAGTDDTDWFLGAFAERAGRVLAGRAILSAGP